MEFIDACYNTLKRLPAAIAGWRLNEVNCAGGSLSSTWGRDKGFSAPPKDFVIDLSGNTATFGVPLPTLTPRGHETLIDPVEVTRRYLAQNWPGSIARIPDDPPPPPPPDYKGEWNPPPAPWVKRSFTLTVPVLPWNSPLFLGDLPGTIVNSLKFSTGGVWSIDGVIYENRR